MKFTGISQRDRRAFIIGVGLLAVAWVATRGLPVGARAYGALVERHAAAQLDLRRARTLLAGEAAMRDSLAAAARTLLTWAPRFVAGASPAETQAELAALLRLAADRSRLRIVALNPSADSAAGLFARVQLLVRVEGDIAGFSAWISAIERGQRLLTISAASIDALEPLSPAPAAETLRAEMVIAGLASPVRAAGQP